MMNNVLIVWNKGALRLRRCVGALVLALMLCLAVGATQARAAAPAFVGNGSLSFIQPSYQGMIGGPPGARVEVKGFGWLSFSTVTLSVIPAGSSCGGVSVGSFLTGQYGALNAGFFWPTQVNHLGSYAVCGSQVNGGSAVSTNTFSVLASGPPTLTYAPGSIVAGETLTVTGQNWVPGPQNVDVEVVPCDTICNAVPVAQQTIVTTKDGTFSQQLTISAGAPSGEYYVQAVDSTATLSVAPAGPVYVAGQAASVGTPLPGINPTTITTRITQGSPDVSTTAPSPLSQASTDLKNALLAAGIGLVLLLVLIGGLAFFIGRARGPDLPARARPGDENEPARAPPGAARQETWRAGQVPGAAAQQPGLALALQQSRQGEVAPAGEDEPTTADEELSTSQSSEDEYPWEERIPPPPPDPELLDQGKRNADISGKLYDRSARHLPPRRFQRPEPPGDQGSE